MFLEAIHHKEMHHLYTYQEECTVNWASHEWLNFLILFGPEFKETSNNEESSTRCSLVKIQTKMKRNALCVIEAAKWIMAYNILFDCHRHCHLPTFV